MGFRFRKSVRIFPGFRVNFSTRGVSASVGGAPFTVNVSKRGIRSTASIPGTGLSFVHQHGGRSRASNSLLRPQPELDTGSADSGISRKTRAALARHLALAVKDARQESDGIRYAFDIQCKDCGGHQIEAPDGPEDDQVAYCRACRVKFGTMADVRAYAHEKAAEHFIEARQREAVAAAAKRREIFSGAVALAVLGAIGWWWVKSSAPVRTPAVAAYSAPASPPALLPIDSAAPDPRIEPRTSEAGPNMVLAPLPPPRPASLGGAQ